MIKITYTKRRLYTYITWFPYIPLTYSVTESDLPEITLLVVDKNKQCNHSLHCLFWIITPLVFRCYSISIFSSCSLSVFSKRPVHRHFSWKIPETTIKLEVSAVTPMDRGFREVWKNGKSFFSKIADTEWYFIYSS